MKTCADVSEVLTFHRWSPLNYPHSWDYLATHPPITSRCKISARLVCCRLSQSGDLYWWLSCLWNVNGEMISSWLMRTVEHLLKISLKSAILRFLGNWQLSKSWMRITRVKFAIKTSTYHSLQYRRLVKFDAKIYFLRAVKSLCRQILGGDNHPNLMTISKIGSSMLRTLTTKEMVKLLLSCHWDLFICLLDLRLSEWFIWLIELARRVIYLGPVLLILCFLRRE